MPVKCPLCETSIAEAESTQSHPSVVNVKGEEGATAIVSTYKCGCGHRFTSIEYEHKKKPPLTESWPFSSISSARVLAALQEGR